MNDSLHSPSRSRERKKTSIGTIDNSALSEVSSDRNDGASDKGTLSVFFEDVFFPLWTVWRNFKTCLMPKYKFPEQYEREMEYLTLISKNGDASEDKAGKCGHEQPISDPGNLIIGLPPQRKHGRYRLQVLPLKHIYNDGLLMVALRRVYKPSRWRIALLSTVTQIRVARMLIHGSEIFVVAFDDMPPNDRPPDYMYSPQPPKKQQPFDLSNLAQAFNCLDVSYVFSDRWINQLPKLKSRYNYLDCRNQTEAWGIVIIERLDKKKALCWIAFAFSMNISFCYPLMYLFEVHPAWMFALPHNLYIIAVILYHGLTAAERLTDTYFTPSSDSISEWIVVFLRAIVPRVRWFYYSWRSFLTYSFPIFGDEYLYASSTRNIYSNNDIFHKVAQGHPSGTKQGAGTRLFPIHTSPSSRPPYEPPQNLSNTGKSNENNDEERRHRDPDPDPNGTSDPEAANLYLHLIISQGTSGKQQLPINVTNLQNDYQLSYELNRAYRKHRGHWKALFSVRKLRPTKYILLNHAKHVRPDYNTANLASTMPDLVNGLNEYVFSYRPPDVVPQLPLLHEEQLTCLYFNPDSYVKDDVYDQQCFERAPKRKVELQYTGEGYPEGYGFEFVESFDIKFVLTCELLLVAVAFIFAFVYFGVAHDPQKTSTAAQIAGLVFLIGQFMYGIIFALSERFEAWRFF